MSGLPVLIIDDHQLVRSTLVMVLAGRGIAATAIGPADLPGFLRRPAPPGGLVLLDLDLGADIDGALLVPELGRLGWRVLVLTGTTDESRLALAVAGGAVGWVSKAASLDDLVDRTIRAGKGQELLADAERARLGRIAWSAQRAADELDRKWARLTPRELEVVGCLAAGMRPASIADQSFTSLSTVRTQIKSILGKLEVTSQLEVAALAHRRRLRSPPRFS